MGNGVSRSKDSEFADNNPIVFYNTEVQIPVSISPELLLKLEQQSRIHSEQECETISDEVSAEAVDVPPQHGSPNTRENSGDAREELSSVKVLHDAQVLSSKVQRVSVPGQEHTEKAHMALSAVLSCYRNNSDRPLDCWQQVAILDESLRKAEKDYLSSI